MSMHEVRGQFWGTIDPQKSQCICMRSEVGIFCYKSKPEMNIPKEIRSSVPDPSLSTIDCILGLTQLCRLSSPAALQVA